MQARKEVLRASVDGSAPPTAYLSTIANRSPRGTTLWTRLRSAVRYLFCDCVSVSHVRRYCAAGQPLSTVAQIKNTYRRLFLPFTNRRRAHARVLTVALHEKRYAHPQ